MTSAIAIFLAPLFLLTLGFVVEVLAGLRPLRDIGGAQAGTASAAIIVPAHDEEAILSERLGSLRSATGSAARILVVADNCTDSTAEIARDLGVEVVERNDRDRRGKGFALDFARRHLEAAPPAVVLIIDADCTTDAQSIRLLIARCSVTGRPCQATNLQIAEKGASAAVQLSTFAFFIKNVIRQRALQRLAGRAHLLGTGMAMPWPIFARAELATDNIVEDLKLGHDLAHDGDAPLFVEPARVSSNAETERNTFSQRQRWEGGFLQNALRTGPALMLRSLARLDARGLWAALNLMIPPVALLITLDLAALLAAGAVTWMTGAETWPLLAFAALLGLAAAALALAWAAGGSRFVSLGTLVRIPLYLAWKLPLYLKLARSGAPKQWQRTDRGDLPQPGPKGGSSQARVLSPEIRAEKPSERP